MVRHKYLPQTLKFLSPFFDDEEDEFFSKVSFSKDSGLSVYEEDSHVFVEAALPGLDIDDIELTFEKGMLWIRGNKKEDISDKSKKFYRKALTNFSYHISIPGDIDQGREPEAELDNGMMKIKFHKLHEEMPKRIKISRKK